MSKSPLQRTGKRNTQRSKDGAWMQRQINLPAPASLGIGPRDVQAGTVGTDTGPAAKDAERRRWIAEAFVGARAGEIVAGIEAGRLGPEILKQWRRYRTCAEKAWPWT